MHDALRRYEPDTFVVDVDDRPSQRACTEDLTMQVLHAGAWHRRTPDLATTACGDAIHGQFTPTRREDLKHPLSKHCGCFTSFELSKADERERAESDQ